MRLGLGTEWNIAEAFQREHSVASRFMTHPDFVEGVEALLVRKEAPRWDPATVEESTEEDAADFVTPRPGEQRLVLLRELGGGDEYNWYPHAGLGLPSEEEVKSVVQGAKWVRDDLVRWFVDGRSGKGGVREKVVDVLERKTERGEEGYIQWKN